MTRMFAVELARRNPRVRVNAVLPGPVMLPASLSAAGGDVKFTQDSGAVLTGSSSFSAPGGSAILQFSSAQGGKLSAKGTQVTTQMMVSGTNETNVVAGTFGIGGPSIAVSAKNNVDITAP